MATTKFKGQPVKVIGEFIKVGAVAPDFELVKTDLSSFSLKELNGKNVILNIFPSLIPAYVLLPYANSMNWLPVCRIRWYWLFQRTCLLHMPVFVRRKVLRT